MCLSLFSTAAPPAVAHALMASLEIVAHEPERRTRLLERAAYLRRALAAAGIGNFSKLLSRFEARAPIHRGITIDEVGNVAAFLFSDLASAITGEIVYVDGGYSTVAVGAGEES